MLAARRCGLDMICRTLRERKSRLTPRRITILSLLFPPSGYAISAGHRTTDKTSFIIRARRPRPHTVGGCVDDRDKGRAVTRASSPNNLSSKMIARDSTGRENLSRRRTPGLLNYASARDSVCTNNITHNREDRKISSGFTHPFAHPRILMMTVCNLSSN